MDCGNPLDPKEAARRFASDPDSVYFPLNSFLGQFGLTETEFKREARSGRLLVSGVRASWGFQRLRITAGDAVRWLAHPDTPQKFKDQFERLGKPDAKAAN